MKTLHYNNWLQDVCTRHSVWFPTQARDFHLSNVSRHWGPCSLLFRNRGPSLGTNWQGHEADHMLLIRRLPRNWKFLVISLKFVLRVQWLHLTKIYSCASVWQSAGDVWLTRNATSHWWHFTNFFFCHTCRRALTASQTNWSYVVPLGIVPFPSCLSYAACDLALPWCVSRNIKFPWCSL